MARQRTICIAKENLNDFSDEVLESLNEKYRVVCVSDTPIERKSIKTTIKKPAAFATLRKNSILFDGNVEKCKEELAKLNGKKYAFDFDGVINSYVSGWAGPDKIIDEPVEGIMELIKELKKMGKDIVVYSSRCNCAIGIAAMDKYIQKYGTKIDIFLENIDDSYILIDDRVIDYTKIDDIVDFLENFDSWVNKNK